MKLNEIKQILEDFENLNKQAFHNNESDADKWMEWQSIPWGSVDDDGIADIDLKNRSTCAISPFPKKNPKFTKVGSAHNGVVYYDTSNWNFGGNPLQALPMECTNVILHLILARSNPTVEGISEYLKECVKTHLILHSGVPITGGVLGITTIPGIVNFIFLKDRGDATKKWTAEEAPWVDIVNRNLGDPLKCQQELIDANLEEYAKM